MATKPRKKRNSVWPGHQKPARTRSEILENLMDCFSELVGETDPDVIEIMIRIEALNSQENQVYSPADNLDYIEDGEDYGSDRQLEKTIKSWQKLERAARHNLDFEFFEKLALALKRWRDLRNETDSNSSTKELAIKAIVVAEEIIRKQEKLPSWPYLRSLTEVKVSIRHALVRLKRQNIEDEKILSEKFKEYFKDELGLFRYRASKRLIKWYEIRKRIRLESLPDYMSPQEKEHIEALLS